MGVYESPLYFSGFGACFQLSGQIERFSIGSLSYIYSFCLIITHTRSPKRLQDIMLPVSGPKLRQVFGQLFRYRLDNLRVKKDDDEVLIKFSW